MNFWEVLGISTITLQLFVCVVIYLHGRKKGPDDDED